MNELVRFNVGQTSIRLVSPPGQQIARAGVWESVSRDELQRIIGLEAMDAMVFAVVKSVDLHKGDAIKIRANFLEMIRSPEFRALGFADVLMN